jgi:DEAD/DEAH box helicase domain-containing protein
VAIERVTDPWSALLDAGRADGRLVREAREGSLAGDPRPAESGPVSSATNGAPTAPAASERQDRSQDLPADLHPKVRAALAGVGVQGLYTHQAQALRAAWAGPTIVTTGTASGKSLCFHLPTLEVLCRDRRARALYVYPTKALAQDQARALAAFGLHEQVRPAIYDGDTPREARAQIRRGANVVITNPDMLHVGILPNHAAWGTLFANLAVVVIDEAHVYRGVFGSHVAGVLRRLRRIAAAYGTEPRFLLASATIANPRELAERLTGLDDVQLIDRDGSPPRRRQIAMWNPPLTDRALGVRRSALAEAAELVAGLVREGARTICFLKSRKGVEVLARLVREQLDGDADADGDEDGDGDGDGEAGQPAGRAAAGAGGSSGRGSANQRTSLADLVASYRGGYTPQQRRELEGRLTRGELRAVIATDALELGIDVGELDAAVVVAFPGTVASLRQMWGRAGRRGRGLAVYVAGEDALDQFFCRHPEEFLERPVEAAILDCESPGIYPAHLLCAAFEGPLSGEDAQWLGPRWEACAEQLVAHGELRRRPEGTYVPRRPGDYPAGAISLRSASRESFAIVDGASGEVLGSTEAARAHATVHEGAIYMHLGRVYEVHELDLERRRAVVAPFDGDWYTQPKRETDTAIERLLDRRELTCGELAGGERAGGERAGRELAGHELTDRERTGGELAGVRLSFGEVSVTDTVLAYQRRRWSDHAQIDLVALDLPQTSFRTQALWYELDSERLAEQVPREELLGALHAAEHAQIAVLPLLAMCDRWDIGGLSTNLHPQTGGPTIFIYDGHPGGVGLTRQAFVRFEELCRDAHRLIAECPCREGCPSCVQSPKCGNLNEPLSKLGARLLLGAITGSDAAQVDRLVV